MSYNFVQFSIKKINASVNEQKFNKTESEARVNYTGN